MYNRHLPLPYQDRYAERIKYRKGNRAPTAVQFCVGLVCPLCKAGRGSVCVGVKYPHSVRVRLALDTMMGRSHG